MAKRKRRVFTKEFKAQAVRIVRESGKSVPAAGTGSHGDGAAVLGAAGGDRRGPRPGGSADDRGTGGTRAPALLELNLELHLRVRYGLVAHRAPTPGPPQVGSGLRLGNLPLRTASLACSRRRGSSGMAVSR